MRNAHLFSGGGLASPCWEFKGSQKTKNVALKKLVWISIFRLIPYIHKNWNFFALNLPVQGLGSKSGFLENAKIEGSNVKNEMSHVKKFFILQLFVNFSTDSDSSEIKFFRTGSKYTYIFIQKFQNHIFDEKKLFFFC